MCTMNKDRLEQLACFGRSVNDKHYPWKLNEQSVEDAWFLFTLISFYCHRGILDSTDLSTDKIPSQRCNIDYLCERAWELISSSTNPWIYHKCDKVGCSEGNYFRTLLYLL